MKKYPLLLSGLVALIGSLVVNALLIKIFLPLTGVPANAVTFTMLGPSGAFTVIGVLGATIVFALIRRFSKNSNKVFVTVATIVLLISFLPDIFVHNLGPMFAEITTGGIILLIVLHIAVAIITVTALTRLTKPPTRALA